MLKIVVEDDGTGFRYSKKIVKKNQKSGFGLFNVRHRIEYLGGNITVESKIGRGTSVTLMFPCETIKMKRPQGRM
jgi:signal transduction histidine kinase